MKYEVELKIKTIIDVKDESELNLREKSWNALSKIFEHEIFEKQGDCEEFITRTKIEKK